MMMQSPPCKIMKMELLNSMSVASERVEKAQPRPSLTSLAGSSKKAQVWNPRALDVITAAITAIAKTAS